MDSRFPWNVVIYNGSNRVEYLISLCRPLNSSVPECSQNTSVCQLSSLKNVSLGVHNTSFQMSEDVARRELTLALESQDYCPDKDNNQKMRTFIIFKCGKTLVSFSFNGHLFVLFLVLCSFFNF